MAPIPKGPHQLPAVPSKTPGSYSTWDPALPASPPRMTQLQSAQHLQQPTASSTPRGAPPGPGWPLPSKGRRWKPKQGASPLDTPGLVRQNLKAASSPPRFVTTTPRNDLLGRPASTALPPSPSPPPHPLPHPRLCFSPSSSLVLHPLCRVRDICGTPALKCRWGQ